MPGNIVLIGFSGTGKSTVSRVLAARLGWELIDTDDAITGRFCRSIAAVFRDEGEQAFRKAEREEVAAACAGSCQVISVGGGATVDRASRDLLRQGNFVVRLDASPDTILDRLRHGPHAEERPMIAGNDPLARIKALLEARTEAYAFADLTVQTEGQTVSDIVEEVAVAVYERFQWGAAR